VLKKAKSVSSSSSSTHTAQLSGATRNMRFMQRGKTTNSRTSRHSFPPHNQSKTSTTTEDEKFGSAQKATDENRNSSRSVSTLNEASTISGDSTGENRSLLPENVNRCTTSSNSSVTWEKATPLDMYGKNTCILLGRRSYNGFNAITASNLHMQQQHWEYEEKLQHRRKSTRDSISKDMNFTSSDHQRYVELSKKVKQDEKRTLPRRDKISNSKKRRIDILKLVES
jgi:hypothetical protein